MSFFMRGIQGRQSGSASCSTEPEKSLRGFWCAGTTDMKLNVYIEGLQMEVGWSLEDSFDSEDYHSTDLADSSGS